MSPDVIAFLDYVAKREFFQNVGAPIQHSNVCQVSGWDEALQSCSSQEWEDFTLDRHNELAAAMPIVDKRFDAFIGAVKVQLESTLRDKVASLPLRPEQKELVKRCMTWDFLHACDEIEFTKRYKTRWHRDLTEWYFRGHFPCGWEGEWPEGGEPRGCLIVF